MIVKKSETAADLIYDILCEMYIGKTICDCYNDENKFVVAEIEIESTYDGMEITFWDKEKKERTGLRNPKHMSVYAFNKLPEIVNG